MIIIGAFRTVPKGLVKELEDLEITEQVETIQTIIKIDKNTEKSPGNLRSLAVTQTPAKSH